MPAAEPVPGVAVIGGGITGLAAAYALQKKARKAGLPLAVTLFEGSTRLGGKVMTEQDGELLIEGGPDSFVGQKPWALELARELGLEDELIGPVPGAKQLFVVDRGRLVPLPEGFMFIVPTRIGPFLASPLFSWGAKLRMGLDLVIPPRHGDGDESVADFIRRRLGGEALRKTAGPLMGGIHVSDPERQSLLGTFPHYRALEKEYGSLIRGMAAQRKKSPLAAAPKDGWKAAAFISLRGGMERLTQALAARLDGVQLLTGCPVTGLAPLPGGGWQITAAGGSTQAQAVVLAAPAYASAGLVQDCAPGLAATLGEIRYLSTATVTLAYRQADWADRIPGSGFIGPRQDGRQISACTVSSNKFPGRAPEGVVLVRCFLGGPDHEAIVGWADDQITAAVRAELGSLLGLKADPLLARVFRYPLGNPQYDVGHLDRVRQIKAGSPPGLFLAGSAYEGVGLPDCIRQGQQAAAAAWEHLTIRNERQVFA